MVKSPTKTGRPLDFFGQAVSELKKVRWPTKREAVRLTMVVILFSTVVGIFIGSLDYIFTKLLAVLLATVK